MAITDYASLAAEIKVWAARENDPKFNNRIETFIAFAEDRIYKGQGAPGDALYSPPVAAAEMETSAVLTFVAGEAPLPSNLVSLRLVRLADDACGLEFLTPKQFWLRDAEPSGYSNPYYYTVEGSKIIVTPSYDGDLQILYSRAFDSIKIDNPTGVMLTAYPMLYLSGCLFEAFSYMQDTELAAGHWARYVSQVSGINRAANAARFGGGPKRIRVRNAIP